MTALTGALGVSAANLIASGAPPSPVRPAGSFRPIPLQTIQGVEGQVLGGVENSDPLFTVNL
jgi:hypothetical protein